MSNETNIGAVAVGSRLLIKIVTVGDEIPTTKSKIILTDEFTQKQLAKGVVLSKGNKCGEEVGLGDTVAFERHGALEVEGLGKDFRVIDEDTILVRYV